MENEISEIIKELVWQNKLGEALIWCQREEVQDNAVIQAWHMFILRELGYLEEALEIGLILP